MVASAIACLKVFFQKIDQSFPSFFGTRFGKNNLNVATLTLQKVSLVWIFRVLHAITSDTLRYILCLNISIISNVDICPKFDTYAADGHAAQERAVQSLQQIQEKRAHFEKESVLEAGNFSLFLRSQRNEKSQFQSVVSYKKRQRFHKHDLTIYS